jgi:phage terminase large subunit-like protein
VTRLAQVVDGVPQKAFYDANPPSRRSWLHSIFVDKVDPDRHQPLASPESFGWLLMNPGDNRANLTAEYLADLDALDERRRNRFFLGLWSDDAENALWTVEMLDRGRLLTTAPPAMSKVVIGVDPSGCSGPEDLRSDEVGISVCGLGVDGKGYVLEDLSGRYGVNQWKEIVASAYNRHRANVVVCERNFGGDLVIEVLRTAVADGGLPLAVRPVDAARGKHVRAEPIAVLWQQNRVSLVGRFHDLEQQMLAMTTAGYRGDRSPDRLDACVWALHELFPAMAREARDAAAGPDAPRRHREWKVIHSAAFLASRPKGWRASSGYRR